MKENRRIIFSGGRNLKEEVAIDVRLNMWKDTVKSYRDMETWNGVNEDVPPITKYEDFVASLKTNKEINGLLQFVKELVLPILEKKQDLIVKKVLELLDVKYGRIRIEVVEYCIKDWVQFREEHY